MGGWGATAGGVWATQASFDAGAVVVESEKGGARARVRQLQAQQLQASAGVAAFVVGMRGAQEVFRRVQLGVQVQFGWQVTGILEQPIGGTQSCRDQGIVVESQTLAGAR